MPRIKYISTGPNPYSIDLMDNGMLRTFDFRGGVNHPVFIPPSYSTSDVKEQQLLESYPMFNVNFKIDRVTEDEVPSLKFKVESSKQTKAEAKKEEVVEKSEPGVVTEGAPSVQMVVPETIESVQQAGPVVFKNAQEAKSWMMREKKVSANAIRNKDLLLAKAKEMGIDLILESDINN